MTDPISPLAPNGFPALPEIAGVRFATINAGVKYQGRDDVMLAELSPGCAVAGVFTKSRTRSSAVDDCAAKIGGPQDSGAVFLVNSGNANAFTGAGGKRSVDALVAKVSENFDATANRIFTASTGVIGEPLDHAKISDRMKDLKSKLSSSGAEKSANAIMTTDTFAKGGGASVPMSTGNAHLSGFAKGSGMIAPDMATMLAFVFTDANLSQSLLQEMVALCADQTFNCISVDSDTSTSDTLLVAATGQGDTPEITSLDSPDGQVFFQALKALMLDLAHQVVRDGEGASKFIAVQVTGATTADDARKVARSVANSPLVKTAVAGEDPNWGRVVMAVGKSGAQAERDQLSIYFGDILVAEKGWVAAQYTEQSGVDYMKNQSIEITVDLGLGNATSTMWTCDLTHGYITINADYRS